MPEDIQERAKNTLKEIYKNPYTGKKLLGDLEGDYSFRIGNYRIIYFIDEKKNIWIEAISHRKDVYRKK